MMTKKVPSVRVVAGSVESGLLEKRAQFSFSYFDGATEEEQVALAMLVRKQSYIANILHPCFEMNLPEGYLREKLIERYRKHFTVNEMFFLALQGEFGIGRLNYHSELGFSRTFTGEHLSTILKAPSSEQLFFDLVENYLSLSTISGVQPKILVPESIAEKCIIIQPSLIVKVSGDRFPFLPINEYICMDIARRAGIPVPEFYLSDDLGMFVMKRFDITDAGDRLGMEDFCSIMAKPADKKYEGSYGDVAKAVRLFSTRTKHDLEVLFKMIAVSVAVGNGDAHLKNFSLLYRHPGTGAALSPAYDIVNTTIYLPNDVMALKFGKSKNFPSRNELIGYGVSHCNLTQVETESAIDKVVDAVRRGISENIDIARRCTYDGRELVEDIIRNVSTIMKPSAERVYFPANKVLWKKD